MSGYLYMMTGAVCKERGIYQGILGTVKHKVLLHPKKNRQQGQEMPLWLTRPYINKSRQALMVQGDDIVRVPGKQFHVCELQCMQFDFLFLTS